MSSAIKDAVVEFDAHILSYALHLPFLKVSQAIFSTQRLPYSPPKKGKFYKVKKENVKHTSLNHLPSLSPILISVEPTLSKIQHPN